MAPGSQTAPSSVILLLVHQPSRQDKLPSLCPGLLREFRNSVPDCWSLLLMVSEILFRQNSGPVTLALVTPRGHLLWLGSRTALFPVGSPSPSACCPRPCRVAPLLPADTAPPTQSCPCSVTGNMTNGLPSLFPHWVQASAYRKQQRPPPTNRSSSITVLLLTPVPTHTLYSFAFSALDLFPPAGAQAPSSGP